MAESMNDIMHPGSAPERDPDFPHAPQGWTRAGAAETAASEGLELSEDHWDAMRALHEYFAKNSAPNVRELHDALDERFHGKGGIKYLYQLFPGGPVAQGCRVSGLQPPSGSVDEAFGSVQ